DRASVLIAEDNAINALLAKSALAKAGYEVEVVSTGRAAVDAVKENPAGGRFALILMDLHMPVLDGLDAITEIRGYEYENGLSPAPILVLSADSQEGTRHLVMSHGATDFLVKPLDPHILVESVRSH